MTVALSIAGQLAYVSTASISRPGIVFGRKNEWAVKKF